MADWTSWLGRLSLFLDPRLTRLVFRLLGRSLFGFGLTKSVRDASTDAVGAGSSAGVNAGVVADTVGLWTA